MQNFRRFYTTCDLIANISGTTQDIQNRKANSSKAIPPAFDEKSPAKLGPLITEIDVSMDPLKCTFWEDYILALRGAAP